MTITIEPDRIRWQAQTEGESFALLAILDLVFHNPLMDDIANDHGCDEETELNYCCTPLPIMPEDGQSHAAAADGRN